MVRGQDFLALLIALVGLVVAIALGARYGLLGGLFGAMVGPLLGLIAGLLFHAIMLDYLGNRAAALVKKNPWIEVPVFVAWLLLILAINGFFWLLVFRLLVGKWSLRRPRNGGNSGPRPLRAALGARGLLGFADRTGGSK
jgi:hypothetical protein